MLRELARNGAVARRCLAHYVIGLAAVPLACLLELVLDVLNASGERAGKLLCAIREAVDVLEVERNIGRDSLEVDARHGAVPLQCAGAIPDTRPRPYGTVLRRASVISWADLPLRMETPRRRWNPWTRAIGSRSARIVVESGVLLSVSAATARTRPERGEPAARGADCRCRPARAAALRRRR